jgi:hypothetical protein
VATALGCGARDIVDVEALRAQEQVFAPVASDTTVLRALGEIGQRRRAAIAGARAAARAHLWAQLPGGPPVTLRRRRVPAGHGRAAHRRHSGHLTLQEGPRAGTFSC